MSKTRVLVIDDSRVVRLRLAALLDAIGFTVIVAESAQRGLELMRAEQPDCILLDYQLPGVVGLELLRQIVAEAGADGVAIVMITGEGSESVAVEAMKSGVQDYLVKNELSGLNLQRAIERAIETIAYQRELRQKTERIETLTQVLIEANGRLALAARLDPLTDVVNRRAFEESLTREHNRCVRHGQHYAIIMIDIDHFKQFNDSQGHQAGDECLRRVARCLRDSIRSSDLVGRYGGEEFIVLAPETTAQECKVLAQTLCDRIVQLDLGHPASPTGEVVTISLGVAQGPQQNWEQVIRAADEALYEAKRTGRNRVCVDEPGASASSKAA